jgi:hypothetical protein
VTTTTLQARFMCSSHDHPRVVDGRSRPSGAGSRLPGSLDFDVGHRSGPAIALAGPDLVGYEPDIACYEWLDPAAPSPVARAPGA